MVSERLKLAVGSDHAGFELKEKVKEYLSEKGYSFVDFGTFSPESADYPDPIHPLARKVSDGEYTFGIIMCGSGNGVSMTANKHSGIRAALSWIPEIARLGRAHNNANILAMPARFISEKTAREIVDIFLETEFEGGRHQNRIDKINKTDLNPDYPVK